MTEDRALEGGLLLRAARPEDHAEIVRISAEAHGEVEEAAVRQLLEPGGWGPGEWLVVVDGERVVSTCTLLAQTLRVGPVELPVGQVEYVATDPAYRRRGLVAALFAEQHRASVERGDLVNLVYGIPYFYRRLGYGYGLSAAPRRLVRRPVPAPPDDHTVREATPADLGAIEALDRQARAAVDVALLRTTEQWRWLIEHREKWKGSLLVVEHGAAGVVGWVRAQRWDDADVAMVEEVATASVAGAHAALAAATTHHPDVAVWARDRLGTPVTAAFQALTEGGALYDALYVRFPDPAATVDALRPVLSARLKGSALGAESGELDISLYNSGIRIRYEPGEVVSVEAVAGDEDPLDNQNVGVAPDAFPALVLGRFDPLELELRHDDVGYGRHRALMTILFPRQTADVLDIL